MYYVYILELNNGRYYVGSTPNLKRRLKEHKDRECLSTRNYKTRLIFYAVFDRRITALRFEKYLKTGSGIAFRNKRLI